MVHSDSRDLHALLPVKALQEIAIDTENRLRRNNIRILRFPEKAEGSRPAEFAETLLTKLFDFTDIPPTFVVELAHRVPPTPPILGAPAH